MYLLRRPILALSANNKVKDTIVRAPVTRHVVQRFVAGETSEEAAAAVLALRDRRAAGHHGPPRRGHHRAGRGRRDGRRLPRSDPGAGRGRLGGRHRGLGQAVGGRPGPADVGGRPGRWSCLRTGRRRPDRRRGLRRRRQDDPGHGGPHDGRLDPGDPQGAPAAPPGHRRGDPGDAATAPNPTCNGWSGRVPGSGWSRAPTTNRRRWPSRARRRSTSPTSAA